MTAKKPKFHLDVSQQEMFLVAVLLFPLVITVAYVLLRDEWQSFWIAMTVEVLVVLAIHSFRAVSRKRHSDE